MKWQQLVGNKSGRYKWYFPESWVILTPAHSETEATPSPPLTDSTIDFV